MRKWKLMTKLLLMFVCMTCVGCDRLQQEKNEVTTSNGANTTSGKPEYGKEITVSRIAKTTDGKTYIEVDGKPFLYAGAQVRQDLFCNVDFLKAADIEKYFAAAAKLGVTCIGVPIQWSDIEYRKDEYAFTKLDTFFGFCNKYNLKMEILWFGSVMCGSTHSLFVPSYLLNEGDTYPKEGPIGKDDFGGIAYRLDVDNPNILERESKAVAALMDHIWEWDRMNGGKHPIIGVQVENEPDSYPRWQQGDWSGLYTLLDTIGKTVKDSKYKVVTRVNVTCVNDVFDWVESIFNLEGIDIVGPDPYCFSPVEIKDAINNYSGKLPGNFAHIPENKAAIPQCDSLMLSAFATGGGYNMYELATVLYAGNYTEEFGILNRDLTDKPYTQRVRNLLRCLRDLYVDVVLTPQDNFAAFNINTTNPKLIFTQTANAGNVAITYDTSNGGLAGAMVCNGYIAAFTTTDGKMSFDNASLGAVETGSYDAEGRWKKDGAAQLKGNTLEMKANTAYRIALTEVGSKTLQSTTQANIGEEMATGILGDFTPIAGDWSYADGVYTTYLLYSRSAMAWNGGNTTDFHFAADLNPRMITGVGLGMYFGASDNGGIGASNADYVKIGQSWWEVWTEVKVGGKVYNNHFTLQGKVDDPKQLVVDAAGGRLKVTYGGQSVFDEAVTLRNGHIGLTSWGSYFDYQNVKIVKK